MNAEFQKLSGWLLTHSLQAGALVLLVLTVQWLFRRQLTNRWRFALWWIVLVRLLLPFNPESTVSLFNFVRPHFNFPHPQPASPSSSAMVLMAPADSHQNIPATTPAPPNFTPIVNHKGVSDAPLSTITPETSATTTAASPVPVAVHHTIDLAHWLVPGAVVLWFAGIVILIGIALSQTIRFRSRLTRFASPASETLRQELDQARRLAGISRHIELLETDAVKSPALFGLWRLRLLLPRNLEEKFTPGELRYIFLHELAHVKRGDLWLNWLVTGLQILHWFNPLIWLGFARLRADRELACDELALIFAGDRVGTTYGETVVKLLENLNRPAAVPGLMGILEDKHQMRRRIATIARFRPPGRWSMLAVLLVAVVAAVSLSDAQSEKPATPKPQATPASTTATAPADQTDSSLPRPDLTGVVSAKAGGPLPVPATVFIDTAAPRTGTSTFCPSCYADCVKHSPTDAQGNFKIESLDPQLTFKIIAVAKGYRPKSVSKVDPAKGPVNIKLEPIESADATPDRSLRGRVVDPQGHPVQGAVVNLEGVETKDGGGTWGSIPDIDPLAVTDDHGEFLLTAKKPFDFMDVSVSARGFADKNFTKLPNSTMNELKMTEGAIITGRVLSDGRPLAGVSIGISGVERQSGIYVGHFEIGTDAKGRFTLYNVPPDVNFRVYTIMKSMKDSSAVPLRQFHSGKDGETTDVGDLATVPAHRLAGRLALLDGKPLPDKVRLLVSREDAWDSMQLTLGTNGSFDATGIPGELISLSARVKDYRVSPQNLSMDQMNPFQLIGRMDMNHDLTNILFLLEPGKEIQPDYQHIDPEYNDIRERILHGAEGVRTHAREWSVSGKVIEADTKEPVKNFRVTPGLTDSFQGSGWSTSRAVDGSNGVYSAYYSKSITQPLLKVEADGYLPQVVELSSEDATNVNFALKRGQGPAGKVVMPDGNPAANVTIAQLTGVVNEAGMNAAGELTAMGEGLKPHPTAADGTFSFKPMWGAKFLVAASTNGFGCVTLNAFATNPVIVLEPLGSISGTLKRPSGPGTNETLDVNFAGDNYPKINLWRPADTDMQGRFTFKNLPPIPLRLSYRQKMAGNSGWVEDPLQEVDVKPGQTLEVTIQAGDRPAPETNVYQQPPMPKPIPGAQLKGVVLGPDGQPAADAEVVLQLAQGPFYLALGHGKFNANNMRESGLLVNAGPDGSFALPMYEKAEAVAAVNDDGFAQVTVKQLKSSSHIRLQKWGRIEGTLHLGHVLGTNQVLNLQRRSVTTLNYDFNAFRMVTDDQGHFVFPEVPPGLQSIDRQVPQGNNSSVNSTLATVEVKPGETLRADIGGNGRTITGRLKFPTDMPVDTTNAFVLISTPNTNLVARIGRLKTQDERTAFFNSQEYLDAMKDFHTYSARLNADHSFSAEDVLPGKYELRFHQQYLPTGNATSTTMFTSAQPIAVPPAANANDDSSVDLGLIELKQFVLPRK